VWAARLQRAVDALAAQSAPPRGAHCRGGEDDTTDVPHRSASTPCTGRRRRCTCWAATRRRRGASSRRPSTSCLRAATRTRAAGLAAPGWEAPRRRARRSCGSACPCGWRRMTRRSSRWPFGDSSIRRISSSSRRPQGQPPLRPATGRPTICPPRPAGVGAGAGSAGEGVDPWRRDLHVRAQGRPLGEGGLGRFCGGHGQPRRAAAASLRDRRSASPYRWIERRRQRLHVKSHQARPLLTRRKEQPTVVACGRDRLREQTERDVSYVNPYVLLLLATSEVKQQSALRFIMGIETDRPLGFRLRETAMGNRSRNPMGNREVVCFVHECCDEGVELD